MKFLQIIKKEHQRVGYNAQDIEVVEFKELEAEYNDKNLLIREARFDADGELNTLTLNKYDDNNRLVLSEQYDHDDILLQKTESIYDGDKLAEQTNYYGDASDKYVTKFVYNDLNLPIRQEIFVNGEFDFLEKSLYYENDRLISETENDDYGNPMYTNSYAYDENGRISVFTRDEIQNKDRRTFEFTYNENGDRVKDLIYDYGMKLIAKVNRTFDENHNLLEYVEEDLDNYRHVKMEYSGELVVKNTIFDKNEQIITWAEYEYDEQGREIKSTEYSRDEVNPAQHRIVRETVYIRS